MAEIIQAILENYQASLFIGMFLLGETVLLPAIYYSLEGNIRISEVVVISVAATLVSDMAWYYLARFMPLRKIKSWKRVKEHESTFANLSRLFDLYGLRILFFSKFVYGTRILVQVICGIKRVDVLKYLAVNIAGATAYVLFLYAIAVTVSSAVSSYILSGVKVSLIAFVVFVIAINLCTKYLVQKKLFR
ncbi:MAG TPA: VTT domain-containing protein [Candidatus Paceibacterota bacterium]